MICVVQLQVNRGGFWFNPFNSGRHHRGCLWIFGDQRELLRIKHLYGESELVVNFHVMWFIYLLLLSLLIYSLIYTSPLAVRLLRHILSLTTEHYLMKG